MRKALIIIGVLLITALLVLEACASGRVSAPEKTSVPTSTEVPEAFLTPPELLSPHNETTGVELTPTLRWAEMAVPRGLFAAILGWITRLCLSPG